MSATKRLEFVSKHHPQVFDFVEIFLAAKRNGEFEWPDWCFMPVAAWLAVSERGHEGEPKINTVKRMFEIWAPTTWRYTQGGVGREIWT